MITTTYEGDERRQLDKDLAHLVGEAGAKLSVLEDTRTEFKGLKESVVILAEAIGHSVTAEEVEESARRARFQLLTSILATVIIIVVLGWMLLRGQALGRENQQTQRAGIRCLILQGTEQIYINDEIYAQVFQRFHVETPAHRPLPPRPSTEAINDACSQFLTNGQ